MTWKTLLNFVIPGRPVPWKVPIFGKGASGKGRGRKDERLVAWQQQVQVYARIAMADARSPPTEKLVRVRATFILAKQPPDLTNLTKALEDACNGVIWIDDTQVIEHATRRIVNPSLSESTLFIVETYEPQTSSAR